MIRKSPFFQDQVDKQLKVCPDVWKFKMIDAVIKTEGLALKYVRLALKMYIWDFLVDETDGF